MKRFPPVAMIVVLVGAIVAVVVISGGDDDGTSALPRGDVAKPPCGPRCQSITGLGASAEEVVEAALPGRLEDFLLRLREHGFDVRATRPHPKAPRSLWPTGGLRVETESGPLTIYAYRSQGVVKRVVNPRRKYSFAFPGYRTQWSSGPAGDRLGGCGKYLYFGRNATTSRALHVADLCRGERTEFIIQA
jgi:hypothetical protein